MDHVQKFEVMPLYILCILSVKLTAEEHFMSEPKKV